MSNTELPITSTANPNYPYSNPNRKDDRRVGKRKGWQVAEMWESHHEIARMLLLGWNNQEIAEKMSCSPQQISNVRNSPVVKDKLALMRAVRDVGAIDLNQQIDELAPIALQRVREAIETGTVRVESPDGVVTVKEVSAVSILKEANNLMDRSMGRAVQRVDSRNLHAHLSLDDIERIKSKAKALAGYGDSCEA